jgi:urease accessory protein
LTVPLATGRRITVDGGAEVGFAVRAGRTRLTHLWHHDPVRVLFPLPGAGDLPMAALVTTSGGLVGGDRLTLSCTVGPGAAARIGPQAAEKVYRSAGPVATVSLALQAGEGAWLEYLPMETILFEGARLQRSTRLDLAPGARAMAGEILVFGRLARGEVMATGTIRDALAVYREGRLLWADAFDADGDVLEVLDHPAGLGGARVLATLVYAADDAAAELEAVRADLAAPGGARSERTLAGATVIGPVLVVRWAGSDGLSIRRAYAKVWCGLRSRAGGLPPVLPRLWDV